MGCAPCISRPPQLFQYDDHLIEVKRTKQMSLKLLSYNLFLRPPGISNPGGDFKNERLKLFCQMINDYDIICLQELFWRKNKRFKKLVKHARKSGFKYFLKCPAPPLFNCRFQVVDGGLVILSKYPISDYAWEGFNISHSSDNFAFKGILYAKINLSDYIEHHVDNRTNENEFFIHLFNTHLQATYEGTEKKSKRTRLEQLYQIKDFIDNQVNDSYPIVLLGDFNINAHDEEEYNLLNHIIRGDLEYDFIDLVHEQFGFHPITYGDVISEEASDANEENKKYNPRETLLTHPDSQGAQLRIDYIFFYGKKELDETDFYRISVKDDSTRIQPFYVEGEIFEQLSDHYGVETDLTIEMNNGTSTQCT